MSLLLLFDPGEAYPEGVHRYVDLDISHDDRQIANLVRIARAGGAERTAADATSQAEYLVRTFERSDLIHQTDAESQEYAGYVLSILKDAELRFDSITVDPRADPERLYPQVLGRELGDRITIVLTPPGRSEPIVRDCIIRGIAHEFGPAEWMTTWALQDASRLAFLVLDHAVLGILDSNRLAF